MSPMYFTKPLVRFWKYFKHASTSLRRHELRLKWMFSVSLSLCKLGLIWMFSVYNSCYQHLLKETDLDVQSLHFPLLGSQYVQCYFFAIRNLFLLRSWSGCTEFVMDPYISWIPVQSLKLFVLNSLLQSQDHDLCEMSKVTCTGLCLLCTLWILKMFNTHQLSVLFVWFDSLRPINDLSVM